MNCEIKVICDLVCNFHRLNYRIINTIRDCYVLLYVSSLNMPIQLEYSD